MSGPPGNSLEQTQAPHVAETGGELVDGLHALLARVRDEIDFNTAKGSSPYRLGMHDALRFAEDAIVDLLRAHGHEVQERPQARDA